VVFWHTSGGRSVNYGSAGGVPPWWTVFSDLAEHGLSQRRRQYFVRVSANVSWTALEKDMGFHEVMEALRTLLNVPEENAKPPGASAAFAASKS
jgi:hypothetical protein